MASSQAPSDDHGIAGPLLCPPDRPARMGLQSPVHGVVEGAPAERRRVASAMVCTRTLARALSTTWTSFGPPGPAAGAIVDVPRVAPLLVSTFTEQRSDPLTTGATRWAVQNASCT